MTAPESDIEIDGLETPESLSPVANEERAYGRYLLQYEIASGGMASVYLARATGAAGFERPIAIKRIHPHLARKPTFVDMFLDEARLNARIAHPNVCSVLDFGEADGSYFMAMEYLVGQPLSRVLGAVSVRPDLATSPRWHALAARILADACQGLHAAHELVDEQGYPLHVIHRDFTPHNVFVTYDGAVKVFDFGVARAEGRVHQTETGMLKGKLAYMSPEQLARATIDRRLDVWAAGVCLWELLTLRRLFGKRSEIEIVQAIGGEPILEPSLVRAGVPRELDAITMRALERDPDRRTNSARILARELNQYASTTGQSTSLSDVADLMSELFSEERARKLDVVANILRSEELDLSDTSAVQRTRAGEPRSSAGSVAAPRNASRTPGSRTPASVRAPALGPPAAATRRDPTGATRAPISEPAVPEEATTQSSMALADMLEPPSEKSLSLHLDLSESQAPAMVDPSADGELRASIPSSGSRSKWMLAAIASLVLLGVSVFVVVASGVLEGETVVTGTPPTSDTRVPAGTTTPPPGTTVATAQPTGEGPEAQGIDPPPEIGEGPVDLPADGVPVVDDLPVANDVPVGDEVPVTDDETATGDEVSSDVPDVVPGTRVRRGAINVAARGGWADLYIDGRASGRTPRSISLLPGRHLVELRPPGAAPIRRAVTIRSGRTQRLVIDL